MKVLVFAEEDSQRKTTGPLAKLGHDVHFATTAKAALLGAIDVDLVIVDARLEPIAFAESAFFSFDEMLPYYLGISFAKRMRRNHPKMSVIILYADLTATQAVGEYLSEVVGNGKAEGAPIYAISTFGYYAEAAVFELALGELLKKIKRWKKEAEK